MISIFSEPLFEGSVSEITPIYFEHIGLLLADLMTTDILNCSTLFTINNRLIYNAFLADLAPPKIVSESDRDYTETWKRIYSGIPDGNIREVYYLLLHNKLPVQERKFRIGLVKDPYCLECLGAEIADLEHFFCDCQRISDIWLWLRRKIESLSSQTRISSNLDILYLILPSSVNEREITWLLSNYLYFVWDNT